MCEKPAFCKIGKMGGCKVSKRDMVTMAQVPLNSRVAESDVKCPNPTPDSDFPKFPTPTPDSDLSKISHSDSLT